MRSHYKDKHMRMPFSNLLLSSVCLGVISTSCMGQETTDLEAPLTAACNELAKRCNDTWAANAKENVVHSIILMLQKADRRLSNDERDALVNGISHWPGAHVISGSVHPYVQEAFKQHMLFAISQYLSTPKPSKDQQAKCMQQTSELLAEWSKQLLQKYPDHSADIKAEAADITHQVEIMAKSPFLAYKIPVSKSQIDEANARWAKKFQTLEMPMGTDKMAQFGRTRAIGTALLDAIEPVTEGSGLPSLPAPNVVKKADDVVRDHMTDIISWNSMSADERKVVAKTLPPLSSEDDISTEMVLFLKKEVIPH